MTLHVAENSAHTGGAFLALQHIQRTNRLAPEWVLPAAQSRRERHLRVQPHRRGQRYQLRQRVNGDLVGTVSIRSSGSALEQHGRTMTHAAPIRQPAISKGDNPSTFQ